MREIKFRALDIDNNVILNDVITIDKSGMYSYYDVLKMNNLMQYTGLTDKNGVEIYEGDIVKYVLWGNEYEIWTEYRIDFIKFKDGEFYPRPISNMCEDGWYSDGLKDFEVIGNIYENPELLEQQ